MRRKDEEESKKQSRSLPASKGSVSFAGGGAKKGSIEKTRTDPAEGGGARGAAPGRKAKRNPARG